LIKKLPESLSDCTLLIDLRLSSNSIENLEVINNLSNLNILQLDAEAFENDLFVTENLTKVTLLYVRDLNENVINEMPLKWRGFKSLNSFSSFSFVVKTNFLFQLFIENFYTLCTENGFLDPSSTEAQNTGFPEQFRDISWGGGSNWFTLSDPIQAPSGFSSGISNGTPANNAEKIYVLVENYGHTVTLAP
jgi:hypothetical protein